jgi:hypothetical protein
MSTTDTTATDAAPSNVTELKPKTPRKPRTPAKPKRTPIKPKGAFKGNALSEAWNRGDAVKKIASDAGLSEADVLQRLDAHSAGFASVAAFVASKATPAKPKPRGAAAAKPKKAAKVERFYRADGYDGKGWRLLGVSAEGVVTDLGHWGEYAVEGAVKAYEAANPEASFADYFGAPARNIWHVKGK